MNSEPKSSHITNFSIGNLSGDGAVLGNENRVIGKVTGGTVNQAETINTTPAPMSEADDLAVLRRILANVKAQVEAEAPPEKKEAALERMAELEEAVIAKEPDLSTMEYIKNWFIKNVPTLAGAVTSVVVHPIVGKIVEAAGETLATDFRHRFGGK